MDFISQEMPRSGDTVLVGMSGGVDSTLTALMLKEKGCRVIGVTMSLYDGKLPISADSSKPHTHSSCYDPNEMEDIEECKKFCEENNIEYHVVDVKQAYHQKVLEYFKSEYRKGRTPNPCVMCNQNVKFGAMLEAVKNLGIDYDYFCTGHYAKIVRPAQGVFGTDVRPFMIATATDVSKDQTYFLCRVPSEVLEKVRFPLATMKKSEVFALAEQAHLDAAKRAESQDFIGEEYFDVIFADKPSVPGDIIDLDGKVLGRHRGIEHYTIGQRRGLGVAVNYPVYVQSIDAKNNVVVLAPNDALNSDFLIADNFLWAGNIEPPQKIEALVKIRLASQPVKCLVERYEATNGEEFSGQAWKITFETPQRAVAPGQAAVLYSDGVILGSGIICKTC